MFTVKHVTREGVVLFEAARVEFRHAAHRLPDRVVAWPVGEGRASECQNGKVYVMNETGATVDSYYLDAPAKIVAEAA